MNTQNWLILLAVALGIGIGKAMMEREEKKKVAALKKVVAVKIASATPKGTPTTPPRRTTR